MPGKNEDEKTERQESEELMPENEMTDFESMVPTLQMPGVPAPEEDDAVRAFDANGREVRVPREEWRNNVLPGMIKQAWSDPEELYMIIVNSLNAGFSMELNDAATHLYETDTVKARGTCMWSIVLMQTGRVDEAETVLQGYLESDGPEGSVLTNLAKVQAMRGQNELAEQTLWQAVETEPNLDNGLGWYVQMQQERGGEEAATEALRKIAALPGSWRAQLWLARAALTADDLAGAMMLYRRALERVGQPVPVDFLMQMSGDLGGRGHLAELLELTEPSFIPEIHGMPVGNNLLKANLDVSNVARATELRSILAAFNRPDWQQALAFWEQEITRVAGVAPVPDQQVQIGMLRVDGAVWLPAGSPARGLLGEKVQGGPSVTFIGGTAEAPAGQQQVLDGAGRLSRALPLFLSEQVELRTNAGGRAMLPWAVGVQSGFVVGSAVWTEEMAVQAVLAPGQESDYVVTVHVDAAVVPWTAELVFIRSTDGATIGELDAEFDPAHPEEGIPGLADEVVELLGGEFRTAGYEVPQEFSGYLARLEQLLAVRCAAMEGVSPGFLQSERLILDGNLEQAEAEPSNLVSRLLLVETFGAVERVRPEVAGEYRSRVEKLTTEWPLTGV